MTGKEKVERSCWYGLFLFMIIAVLSMADCSKSNVNSMHEAVAKMVANGINPKDAGCSIAIANNATAETKLYCK